MLGSDYTAGAPITCQVTLSRDADEDDGDADDQLVVAPYYPHKKSPTWWLVIGESSTKQLHAIKKVTIKKSLTVKLEFVLPKGTHDLKLYVICDSYMGADQDISLDKVEVAEGEDSDDDDDDDDDDEEEDDNAMEE